jgi:hypothetical protein
VKTFLASLALTIATLAGCHHQPPPATVATRSAKAQPGRAVRVFASFTTGPALPFQARMLHVLARPEVDRAFDRFVERTIADPALGAQMQRLAARLLADAKIAADLQAILQALIDSPDVQRQVRQLMKEHPELSADQIGERFGEQVEQSFTLRFMPPFMAAFQRFFAQLDFGPGAEGFTQHLALELSDVLEAYLTPAREAAWRRRLTELNHGEVPTQEVAARLYIDHALSEERVARYLATVVSDPMFTDEVITLVRRSLAVKTVENALYAWLRQMSGDAELRRQCTTALLLLVSDHPDPAAMQATVAAIFTSRSVVGGANDLIRIMLSDREVSAIFAETLTRVVKIPSLARATDELLDRW